MELTQNFWLIVFISHVFSCPFRKPLELVKNGTRSREKDEKVT